jgi:hypothetical protein
MGLPMGIEVWMTFLSWGWAINRRPGGSPSTWPVYRSKFSSGRWPALGVGCRTDDPLNVPRDRLWVVPCRWGGVPQTAGRKAIEFPSEH